MWQTRRINEDLIRTLAEQALIPSALARVMASRGFRDPVAARKFLKPTLDNLISPFALPDMSRAVERIQDAIRKREPILVWGHEDLDGVSAVVCLRTTIRDLRGIAGHYIPPKGSERHGLNPAKVSEFVKEGYRLVVTVDCGTTNFAEIDAIQSSGIDVIVTDHHEVLDTLPKARAIVSSKRNDVPYPFPNLAGVGVALKLAQALAHAVLGFKPEEFFSVKPELLTMAALGSIADRVPLVDENRVLVRLGLEQMRRSRIPAVQAVLEAGEVSAEDLTVNRFVSDLLPLFASADGNAGVDVFLGADLAEARNWTRTLKLECAAWREEARKSLEKAERVADLSDGIVFVRSAELSLRALGYCASRLKEEYLLPVVVMGRRGDNWVGECRGVEGVNLVELLKASAQYFLDYGGHKKACGFTIPDDKAEVFIADAKLYASIHFRGKIAETRDRQPDATVQLEEITPEFRQLTPFGEGNPEPLLFSRDTTLVHRGSRVFCPSADLNLIEDAVQLESSGQYDVLYALDDHLNVLLRALAPVEM
jgi:single-stranded-DNA-specific exonuclease